MSMADRRALFLDRDGTLIPDVGYARDPHQVQLLPGAGRALAALQERGVVLVLVSNQSGIGRGLIEAREAEAVHRRLEECLLEHGVRLAGTYYCPHAPEARCDCRKPSPHMLVQAAQTFGIELSHSFMIGDKVTDVVAGRRAGCRTIFFRTDPVTEASASEADLVASSWAEVLEHVLPEVEVRP
jgi:histidinol-phosphate phosphatase family protein